jgi:hypothetical protein
VAGEQKIGSESEASRTFLVQYARRAEELYEKSLNEFFHYLYNRDIQSGKKEGKFKIPLYTGAQCEAVYPATKAYARAVMLIHCPWHGKFELNKESDALLPSFLKFVEDPKRCPDSVRVSYQRAKLLNTAKEPTTKNGDIDYDTYAFQPDKETEDLVDLVRTIGADLDLDDYDGEIKYDMGIGHDWSKPCVEVGYTLYDFSKLSSGYFGQHIGEKRLSSLAKLSRGYFGATHPEYYTCTHTCKCRLVCRYQTQNLG